MPQVGGLVRVDFSALKFLENILVKIFDALEGQIHVTPGDLSSHNLVLHLLVSNILYLLTNSLNTSNLPGFWGFGEIGRAHV